MSEDGEDEYQYDGHLLFHEICRTKNVDDSEVKKTPRVAEAHLLNEDDGILPRFEEGDSQNQGEGFERSEIREYSHKLKDGTQEFIDSLVALNYKKETYDVEEAEVDPDEPRRPVKIPDTDTADVFWKSPDHLIIRGPKSSAEEAYSELETYLSQIATLDPIYFNRDFLLWLFEKHWNDDGITDILKIDRLTDATVEGSEDILGKINTVNESKEASKAPIVLIGLLLGKSLTKIEGDFVLDRDPDKDDPETTEQTVRVEVTNNKIQIKSSKVDLTNSDNIEKIGYATQIVDELVELNNDWRDRDPKNQLVKPTFLVTLLENAHENDIKLVDKSTILSVLEQQANRRGEDLEEDYDMDDHLAFLREEDEGDKDDGENGEDGE